MIASVRKFKLTNRRNWIIELNWTNVCFRINGGVSIPMTSLLFFIRLAYFFYTQRLKLYKLGYYFTSEFKEKVSFYEKVILPPKFVVI